MNFRLNKVGQTHYPLDIDRLHQHTFWNGKSFPKSYINFAKSYGYGLSAKLFIIYIPIDGHEDSFFKRSAEIISTYQDVIDDSAQLWFDMGKQLTYHHLKYLVPFAWSENGHYLFWDTTSTHLQNECDIYITDFKGLPFTRVAQNLYEFFAQVTSETHFKNVLPFSHQPLPASFTYF